MPETQLKLEWEKTSKAKFDAMIVRIPLFHREIARKVAVKKAEINAQERGSQVVEESDIIREIFARQR